MSSPNAMEQMTLLLRRLEAATYRLEDVASAAGPPKDVPSPGKPPLVTHKAAGSPLSDSTRPGEDYEYFLDAAVKSWVTRSQEIGGIVARQAAQVQEGFLEQQKFLSISSKAARPENTSSGLTVLKDLLEPTNKAIIAANDLKEANRSHVLFDHLACVADGIIVLGWVTIDHQPFAYVLEALASAQFFGNRVLKEYKDKDMKHAEWVQAFYKIFQDLADYVKRHHAKGVAWNPKGQPAQEVAKSVSFSANQYDAPKATPSASSGAPPPPPPGPPPVLEIRTEAASPANDSSRGSLNAVFSEINRGDSVTKGLRKVDQSEMTHKNPSLRAVSDSRKSPAPPGKKPKPESMRVKKSGKTEFEGRKWTIENYEKEPEPVEIEAKLSHSVFISRCNNTTVIIKGKANQITIENSTRLSLIVDTLVSTVDVVKAKNFALQVKGAVPAVMLDQTDDAQIYFSQESSDTQIFTSQCTGVNLNYISGSEDEYKEEPVPSQICSHFDTERNELVHKIVAHAG